MSDEVPAQVVPADEVMDVSEPATAEAPQAEDVVVANVDADTAAPAAETTPTAAPATASASGALPMLEVTGKHPRKAAEIDTTETDDPVQIRKKAEYYFNDANLPEDKFLWEKVGGFDNRPFLIRTLASFSRMRRFKPYSAVVAALRDSETLLVQGAEGEETVKRKVAYQDTPRRIVDAATVYVKGFGDEKDGSQAELEDFFAPYEGVLAVRMRRERDRSLAFKGSVWVVFRDEAAAHKFLALDPKPTYQGHELLIMSKPAYCDMKVKMIEKGEMEPSSGGLGNGPVRFWQGHESGKSRGGSHHGGRGGGNNHNQRGGRGRGGRSGGRGGRGDFKGRNGNNQNSHRDGDNNNDNSVPRDAAHDPLANAQPEEPSNKRQRDDDGGADEPATKKVDNKPEVSVA